MKRFDVFRGRNIQTEFHLTTRLCLACHLVMEMHHSLDAIRMVCSGNHLDYGVQTYELTPTFGKRNVTIIHAGRKSWVLEEMPQNVWPVIPQQFTAGGDSGSNRGRK